MCGVFFCGLFGFVGFFVVGFGCFGLFVWFCCVLGVWFLGLAFFFFPLACCNSERNGLLGLRYSNLKTFLTLETLGPSVNQVCIEYLERGN